MLQLSKAKFVNKNAQNTNPSHMLFKLNYGYHLVIFFKENINHCFYLKIVDKLVVELQKLSAVCYENFPHIEKIQKQDYNKSVKHKSYIPSDKV